MTRISVNINHQKQNSLAVVDTPFTSDLSSEFDESDEGGAEIEFSP